VAVVQMVARKRREAAAGKATKQKKSSSQEVSKAVIKDTASSSAVRGTDELKMDANGLVEKLSCAIITRSFQLHRNPSLKETQFCKLFCTFNNQIRKEEGELDLWKYICVGMIFLLAGRMGDAHSCVSRLCKQTQAPLSHMRQIWHGCQILSEWKIKSSLFCEVRNLLLFCCSTFGFLNSLDRDKPMSVVGVLGFLPRAPPCSS